MSFGVSRQAIKYPNQDWSWHSVKEIFLEPYFMVITIEIQEVKLQNLYYDSFRYTVKFMPTKSIHPVI